MHRRHVFEITLVALVPPYDIPTRVVGNALLDIFTMKHASPAIDGVSYHRPMYKSYPREGTTPPINIPTARICFRAPIPGPAPGLPPRWRRRRHRLLQMELRKLREVQIEGSRDCPPVDDGRRERLASPCGYVSELKCRFDQRYVGNAGVPTQRNLYKRERGEGGGGACRWGEREKRGRLSAS